MNLALVSRFSGCPWYDSKDISVIGLGGVGRGVAETLFLQGHSVTVWDHDTVEAHNMVQGYQQKYVSWKKVDAFKYQMTEYVGDISKLTVYGQKWEYHNLKPIVVACPDNWKTRNDLYEKWRGEDGELFISAGMLADMYHIQVFQKDDGREWVVREDGEETIPCTQRQSLYMAKLIHGRIASIVNKFIINPELIDHEYHYNGLLD